MQARLHVRALATCHLLCIFKQSHEWSGSMIWINDLSRGNMLPLAYDRKVKDLVFLFKAVNGYIDININSFVHFVNHAALPF